jgi:hypothetical protein
MENLVTLKFERCGIETLSVKSVLDRSCVVNLSLRGSKALSESDSEPVSESDFSLPPAATFNSRHTLKVLDFSETTSDFTEHLFAELVGSNEHCAITRLYVEKCNYIPGFNSPDHLKTVQFISVAGSYDYGAFQSIKAWKSLKPAMKFINASGCGMGLDSIADLTVSHRLVRINLNFSFEESPRHFV